MDKYDAIANVLSSGLSLLGLAFVYFWLYRDYRRDLLRTRLFELRAALFDGAREGRIEFDHPAYGLLRSTLNGFLRSGHTVGAWRLLMMALFLDPKEVEELYQYKAKWSKAVRVLDPEVRQWLEDLRREAHGAFFKHLLATTGFVYLVIVGWISLREARKQKQRNLPGLPVPMPSAALNDRLDSVAWVNAARA